MEKTIDILAVGELLIDFIGHQKEADIQTTTHYERFLGGSPTNVAVNTTRLGLNSALVAAVGRDGLGDFALAELQNLGLATSRIAVLDDYPTSIILVSRTSGTPEFIPYREADKEIYPTQITENDLLQTRLFHTTCFALSKDPARTTIQSSAAQAAALGCKLSIDVNYAPGIWPERAEAQRIIQKYCTHNPLIKLSQDDIERFFGRLVSHQEAFDYFHHAGADWICLTMGSKGVKLSIKDHVTIVKNAIPLAYVADATGAGDAFWSGFLFAFLNDKTPEECLQSGLKIAAVKLQHVGGLPNAEELLKSLREN